jgi:alpha-beta hydrolase superfamily lysophospholipase
MKAPEYWTSHYVTTCDPDEIQRAISVTQFVSDGERFELVHFPTATSAPNVLISQGSGGHAYVFAELAYRIHLAGYNVFIMPKHGGHTVEQLLRRHRDAMHHIAAQFNDTIGVYGEGLGGYVAFYLALGHATVGSIVCQNSPAIMTEPTYHRALLTDGGPWSGAARRRRIMAPIARRLVRLAPNLAVPISSYLDWKALVDTREDSRAVETRLVVDGYLHDPDFDRWYPLSAVMSLMSTPPPGPLHQLATPTMFVVARQGPTPAYIAELYRRLPAIRKEIVDIDGSVYWMLSHPRTAAEIVCDWFDSSLTP